jgi:hypothetical protein
MSDSINTWGGTATKAAAVPLFVARRPRWQVLMWQVMGWAFIATGVIGGLSDVLSGKPNGWANFGFFLFFFGGGGLLCLLLAAALDGSRVHGYDQHLDVRVGLGKFRRVNADDIAVLRFGSQSNGGPTFYSLTGWNERRKKLFMVFTGYRGYQELTAWLAERRPEQWADCEAVGFPR